MLFFRLEYPNTFIFFRFKVESDYASTLIFPLPGGKTPLKYFMEDRIEPEFEYFDKWALTCTIPKLKEEDFKSFRESFDEKQRDIHVSDSTAARSAVTSQLNLVCLNKQWFF